MGEGARTSAVGTNAVLLIQLNGTNAVGGGLRIDSASNSLVRGLVINRFAWGVVIDSDSMVTQSTDNRIEGNFIGTNPGGTLDRENFGSGVIIEDSKDNTVGAPHVQHATSSPVTAKMAS